VIRYLDSVDGLTPGQLSGFFVGWPNPPTAETHLEILKRSAHVLLAVNAETDRVVGFINAISDTVLSAYLPLLEVLPEYQGQGIGSELVRRMLAKLESLYMVDLVCDEDLASFYERFGLKSARAMAKRDFTHQSGRMDL